MGHRRVTLPPKTPDMTHWPTTAAKVWKDLWSAGHGVATIDDVPTVAAPGRPHGVEYEQACRLSQPGGAPEHDKRMSPVMQPLDF